MSWNELYHDVIVDHGRYSPYRGLQEGCCHASAHQPSCGDEITMSIRWEEGHVHGLSFEGKGCMISQASTSLACGYLRGLSRADAQLLATKVLKMLTTAESVDVPEELRALAEIRRFPMRVKCATMAWHLALDLLENN